jgi:hypothetical protein
MGETRIPYKYFVGKLKGIRSSERFLVDNVEMNLKEVACSLWFLPRGFLYPED